MEKISFHKFSYTYIFKIACIFLFYVTKKATDLNIKFDYFI